MGNNNNEIYPRKIYAKLLENFQNDKIIILTGARQVGKTTLMRMLQEEIGKKEKTVFLDLDIASNQGSGQTLESFLDFLRLNGYDEKMKRFFVFVDEFQRLPEFSVIMKNVYDHYPNIKIFASGSSSLSIKSAIKESLAGRKFVFEVYPLDFEEFIRFKEDEKLAQYYRNIQTIKSENVVLPASLRNAIEEFISFGGYPEVVLTIDRNEKKKILESIFDLYLEKDVMMTLGVEKVWAYKKIIEILAANNGGILNYDNLAKEAGIHNKTVRSYLSLLEDTYLIKVLRPFSLNAGKEITKSPKVYFLDSGVRNYFLNNFNGLDKRVDKGGIFEGYVLGELLKDDLTKHDLRFWRTKQKDEVDFVIKTDEGVIPVEVKFKADSKGSSDFRQVENFLKKYKQKQGYVLSNNVKRTVEVQNGRIIFLPAVNFVDKVLNK